MPIITLAATYASGRRKSWFKHVTKVDISKTNGYAFEGNFISEMTETDLPEGSIIIECIPRGSVKNNLKEGKIFRVEAQGITNLEENSEYDWRKDFLSFRDTVAELLSTSTKKTVSEYEEKKQIICRILSDMLRHGISSGSFENVNVEDVAENILAHINKN